MTMRPHPEQFRPPPGNPLLQKILRELIGVLNAPTLRDALGSDELNIALACVLSSALAATSGLQSGTQRREKTITDIITAVQNGIDRSCGGRRP
jgi:hypothetical protein